MRKELLITLCAMCLLFCGSTIANAASSWTILTDAAVASHSAGADGLIGTGDDGTSENCNFNTAKGCATNGTPSVGSYSFAKISPVQASSCAAGGATCTANSQCLIIPQCMDCGGGTGTQWSFFGSIAGQSLGTGTFATCGNSTGGFNVTAMNIGATESSPDTGGGCLTLHTPAVAPATNSGNACGTTAFNETLSLDLYVAATASPFTPCQVKATLLGPISPISLTGKAFAGGSPIGSAGACGYGTANISDLMSKAGVSSSGYLTVNCTPGGTQTLPTLATPCLSGAHFSSVIVAYTSATGGACQDVCPSGPCAGGTAEEVQ